MSVIASVPKCPVRPSVCYSIDRKVNVEEGREEVQNPAGHSPVFLLDISANKLRHF